MASVLGKINLSAKIAFAFVVMLAMVAGLGFVSLNKVGGVNALNVEMRDRWLSGSQMIGDLHAYTSQYRIAQGGYVLAADEKGRRQAQLQIKNARTTIGGLIDDYAKLATEPSQSALIGQIREAWAAYDATTDRIVAVAEAGDTAGATELFKGEALDLFYGVEDGVLQLVDLNQKSIEAASARSTTIYGQTRTLMLSVLGGALVVSVLLMVALMWTIARPLARMSQAIKQVMDGDLDIAIPALGRSDEVGKLAGALDGFKAMFAADQERAHADQERARETEATIDALAIGLAALAGGDLTHRMDADIKGPFARLYTDYNNAVTQLAAVLTEISAGCSMIHTGTNEIARASDDLSIRTERQAAALGEAAETLDQFTATVKVTADNARQTSERVTSASKAAENMDKIARQAIAAMRDIETSSRDMSAIIQTIDGLAFQTNLLSLNAAIEAGRAGEAGAAFAVVASQVQGLAQASAEASGRIRGLIATSGKQVVNGVALVEESGRALQQIVDEVSQVSTLMDEIAGAAEHQASAVQDINKMIAAMDTATQHNAAMVEESTGETRNLSSETERLFHQVARFELGQQPQLASNDDHEDCEEAADHPEPEELMVANASHQSL